MKKWLLSDSPLREEEEQIRVGPCFKVACSLINTNSFSILPPNEISIIKKKKAQLRIRRSPCLFSPNNSIPQKTPAWPLWILCFIGLGLCSRGAWLIFQPVVSLPCTPHFVTLIYLCIPPPVPPLCRENPSITEFNIVQLAHFPPNFFIFPRT